MGKTQPETTGVTLLVELKEGVLDPQGQSIKETLHRLGFTSLLSVRTGKVIDLEIGGDLKPEGVEQLVNEIESAGFLQHPLIETIGLRPGKQG